MLPAAAPPAGRRGRDAGGVPPRFSQPARLGRDPTAAAVDHGDHGQPLSHLDHPAGRRPELADYLQDTAAGPPADDSGELVREIHDALRSSRLEYRTVFVLFHEQGRPYEEIAQGLDRPVGTVKTWLHRARLEVLERLRKRGMVPEENAEQLAPSPYPLPPRERVRCRPTG